MWEIENGAQAVTFLIGALMGVCFSMLYDVFKAYRLCAAPKTFAVAVGDFFYFVICTLFTFCLLMLRTLGQPRGYVFIALAFGFIVWRLSLSTLFVTALRYVFSFIKHTFLRFHRAFRRISMRIGDFFVKIIKKFIQTAKKGLKGVKRLVYNHSVKIKKNIKFQEDINGKKS